MDQPVTAAEWLDERVPVEPGGTLYVDLDRGAVDIESHDVQEVWIEASARGWSSGLALFNLEKVGRDVQLDGGIDHWMRALFARPRIQVRARVPRDYSVEIETAGGRIRVRNVHGRVSAQTRGGRIELERVDGPALLRTSGGSIRVRGHAGDLRGRTSGGSIEIDGIDGDIELRTSGGRIQVEDATGEVDAKTSGGRISASFLREPWGNLVTTGGNVQVDFAGDLGADVDARASGGSIVIEHDHDREDFQTNSRFSGPVNGGGSPLRIRASGGQIHLRCR